MLSKHFSRRLVPNSPLVQLDLKCNTKWLFQQIASTSDLFRCSSTSSCPRLCTDTYDCASLTPPPRLLLKPHLNCVKNVLPHRRSHFLRNLEESFDKRLKRGVSKASPSTRRKFNPTEKRSTRDYLKVKESLNLEDEWFDEVTAKIWTSLELHFPLFSPFPSFIPDLFLQGF